MLKTIDQNDDIQKNKNNVVVPDRIYAVPGSSKSIE